MCGLKNPIEQKNHERQIRERDMRIMLFVFVFHIFLPPKTRCVRVPRDKTTGNWWAKKHLVAAALACDSAESGVDLRSKSLTPIAIGVDGWGCFWRIKLMTHQKTK